jgi:predicted NUDIX family NTP pyrophosphohydrolase
MAKKKTAGILLFREAPDGLEVLLVHPGGPFWMRKDEGAWTIPKGMVDDGEDPFDAAKREFREETGGSPDGEAIALEPLRQPSGKVIHAWAMRGEFDPAALTSNTFMTEWPPGSGQQREYPEVDRAGWFSMEEAGRKILKGQAPLLRELRGKLNGPAG